MKSNDPASLQNLNDIVMPAAVDWWPLAGGWYVIVGLLSIAILWLVYRSSKNWFANRYRRAAMRELLILEQALTDDANSVNSLKQLPVLLKRTALSVYPRNQVAALSGSDWFQFLNSNLKKPVFTESMAVTLENIAYSNGDLSAIDRQAARELLSASSLWMKHHLPAVRLKEGGS